MFRCLQDLRSEGGASTDGGPREPGRFANHVLNILDARDREDLAPYLQIFSVCLRQGRAPCSLSGDARQLMLEALAALEATGYSVHVKQVFAEYSRVVRTLRRRDVLLAPLCNSAHSNNGKLPRGALLHLAAAAGPEDAELADLWVNASLGDPHMQEACGDGPHATACRSGGRPQEYLLQCKDIIVRQLRALRRLVPVWAGTLFRRRPDGCLPPSWVTLPSIFDPSQASCLRFIVEARCCLVICCCFCCCVPIGGCFSARPGLPVPSRRCLDG